MSQVYSTDMNDAQWALLEPHVVKKKRRGPKSQINLREVINAIFYRLRTSCQWRLLPKEYPDWSVVSGYWQRWQRNGLWTNINTALRETAREKAGRNITPTAAIIDSRTIKTVQKGGNEGMMVAN
jgi:putative transposase